MRVRPADEHEAAARDWVLGNAPGWQGIGRYLGMTSRMGTTNPARWWLRGRRLSGEGVQR
jgi:hypothetical protein